MLVTHHWRRATHTWAWHGRETLDLGNESPRYFCFPTLLTRALTERTRHEHFPVVLCSFFFSQDLQDLRRATNSGPRRIGTAILSSTPLSRANTTSMHLFQATSEITSIPITLPCHLVLIPRSIDEFVMLRHLSSWY